ncbi:MAG: chemotaxis protein CheW [Nitrospiraceae bacterium]
MSAVQATEPKDIPQEVGVSTDDNQYLTFTLGEELYGVDILKVQEIKGYTAVTRIPNTPQYIKGVLNLRGTIVPIVDLRCRFKMDETKYTMFTVIVVVVVREKVVGLIVDSVSDVLNIDKDHIQDPPEFGHTIDVSFLNGIGKSGDKLVAILNIEQLFEDTAISGPAE